MILLLLRFAHAAYSAAFKTVGSIDGGQVRLAHTDKPYIGPGAESFGVVSQVEQ